jgi:hypothetical protein
MSYCLDKRKVSHLLRNSELIAQRLRASLYACSISTTLTSVVVEVADENDEYCTVSSARCEKLVSLRFCQYRHGRREKQRENYQQSNSIDGCVAVADVRELVHSHNRQYQERKNNERNDQTD